MDDDGSTISAQAAKREVKRAAILALACKAAGTAGASDRAAARDVKDALRNGLRWGWWLFDGERDAIAAAAVRADTRGHSPWLPVDPSLSEAAEDWPVLHLAAARISVVLSLPKTTASVNLEAAFTKVALFTASRLSRLSDEDAAEAFGRLADAAGLSAQERLDKLGGFASKGSGT